MADDDDARSIKEKALFYMTAFFVLLGTFSLFAFLFLVPFVIEPAFTTIFMQFDTEPAWCVTVEVEQHKGVSNCSWTSCREGCTKEVYECTQIRVNYKTAGQLLAAQNESAGATAAAAAATVELPVGAAAVVESLSAETARFERALRDYDYLDGHPMGGGGGGGGNNVVGMLSLADELAAEAERSDLYSDLDGITQTMGGNESEWFFSGARLFPNVKGCGYPPMLNCSIWAKQFRAIGTNYSCYYSRVDPSLVISDLDMGRNTRNLVYAMAIPIPSFIISCIYLTFAYFVIYNEDEESAPLDKNAEGMADEDVAGEGEEGEDEEECQMDVDEVTKGGGEADDENGDEDGAEEDGGEAGASTGSEPLTTPNSDMPSFGHQLKVQMADEMSRASLDGGFMSQSASFQG